MSKTARKTRNKRRFYSPINYPPANVQAAQSPTLSGAAAFMPDKAQSAFIMLAYFKRDMKWSLITTFIVVAILVVLYFTL